MACYPVTDDDKGQSAETWVCSTVAPTQKRAHERSLLSRCWTLDSAAVKTQENACSFHSWAWLIAHGCILRDNYPGQTRGSRQLSPPIAKHAKIAKSPGPPNISGEVDPGGERKCPDKNRQSWKGISGLGPTP